MKSSFLSIHWPIVIVVTTVLYALILISLPFDQVQSTIFLFALLAYWSRIPGMGTEVGGTILFATDFVDLLACVLALNIGGVYGANFQAIINLISRFAGVFPRWETVVKDIIAQYICCLIIPYVHVWTGSDFTKTFIIYSVIRWFLFIPMRFVEPTPRPWPVFIQRIVTVQASTIIVNWFYGKYFGGFFNSIVAHGVQFNWLLFFIVTVVVIVGKSMLVKDTALRVINFNFLMRLLFRKFEGYKKKEEIKEDISDEKLILNVRGNI